MPPEQLLLASLLQALYAIRSERLLLEQLHYNLLFRWFVGLSPDDPIWHPTTFTKNRERLLNEEVMGCFLEKLMGAPEAKLLLSATSTSRWMAPCCRPGRPMPRWSGSPERRTIRRLRHQALARALVLQSPAGSERKEISAASSSATRRIAPATIRMPCCAGNPRPIGLLEKADRLNSTRPICAMCLAMI